MTKRFLYFLATISLTFIGCQSNESENKITSSESFDFDSCISSYVKMINSHGDSNVILVFFNKSENGDFVKIGNNPFIPNSKNLMGCKRQNKNLLLFLSDKNSEVLFNELIKNDFIDVNAIKDYPLENDTINYGVWDPIVWKFKINKNRTLARVD